MKQHFSKALYDPQLEDDKDFQEYMENELKRGVVDILFSDLEEGEKIIDLGKIVKRFIPELRQYESKLTITTNDLIRCKDCIYHGEFDEFDYCICEATGSGMHKNGFCSDAYRKKKDEKRIDY